MLIEQIVEELYVHRKECRLTVAYVEEVRKGNVYGAKLRLSLDSKANNLSPRKLAAEVELEEQQLKSLRRKLLSPLLYIHRRYPRLTVLGYLSIALTDTTSSSTKKEIQTADVAVNYGQKYWTVQEPLKVERSPSWPVTATFIRKNNKKVKTGKINTNHFCFAKINNNNNIVQLQKQIKLVKPNLLQAQKQRKDKKENICQLKEEIHKQSIFTLKKQSFTVDDDVSIIRTNSQLLPQIPITPLSIRKSQQITPKEQLFRHIFLTQLMGHMIINRFGSEKRKKKKFRDGRIIYSYEDEHLQALRSLGHRFYQFRDPSFKKFHPLEREDKPSESEKEKEIDKWKETEVGRIGQKIKITLRDKCLKKKKLTNFKMISGEDKSEVNKKRYCLHQMTRETDKTQAFINFVQLVFSAYWPEDDLIQRKNDNEQTKKKRLAYFMKNFKVKRSPFSCLREYTRESFFHKVLNAGLRILKESHELVYLRFPFSHIFWSIKALYQRHKRAIFQLKKQKNEKRAITLYRGLQMNEAEIKIIQNKVGDFIEMEGFISSSLSEGTALRFTSNVLLIICLPILNLRGMHDNGFASTSHCSAHPSEREVLFNAFNLFKIKSICTKTKNKLSIYEVTLEYGGIKEVEDKVRKSQNLLESEFLMKMEEEKIESVRHLLSMKREKMNPEMVEKLDEDLSKEEKKLEKWKKTLSTQEKQEFKAAYEELSKWEKELLDNFTHQEHTMRHIDNYGELLAGVGDYERGMGYCERMLKQVERDRAIEGWQWRKTPCLSNQQQKHRMLVSQCYHRQCRHKEEAKQLKMIKDLYISLNLPRQHPSYTKLLKQLTYAYKQLIFNGDSEQYEDVNRQYQQIIRQYKLEDKDEGHYHINNTYDKQKQIKQLSANKLEEKISDQRKKLERVSIHEQGKQSNYYRYQHYMLIYMLYQQQRNKDPYFQNPKKRNYQKVKKENKRYFANKQHSQHEYNTLSLMFNLLRYIVDESKEGRKWLRIVCENLISFLTSHIYHQSQISLVEWCMRLCIRFGQRMSLHGLLRKLLKSQISCSMSESTYNTLMKVYLYIWGISKECMDWVKKTQEKVQKLFPVCKKQQGKEEVKSVIFPHSIGHWQRKQSCGWIIDGVQWMSYQDLKQGCIYMEEYYTNHKQHDYHAERQIEHILQLRCKWFERTHKELKSKLEVVGWQHPCEVWNKMDTQYGAAKYMAKGEVMMTMLYLHHSQSSNYTKAVRTISQLHLPQQGFKKLDDFIKKANSMQNKSQIIKKMQKRNPYMRVKSDTQQRKQISKQQLLKRREEGVHIIKVYRQRHHSWKEVQSGLHHL